jgi:hypothetical protein
MLDKLLQTIVTIELSEPGNVKKRAHRGTVYQKMVADNLFTAACGMNFLELVELAAKKGLLNVIAELNELHLKWE